MNEAALLSSWGPPPPPGFTLQGSPGCSDDHRRWLNKGLGWGGAGKGGGTSHSSLPARSRENKPFVISGDRGSQAEGSEGEQ